MTPKTLCFTGFSKEEAASLPSLFEAANARFGRSWQLVPEGQEQVLVIDMDSMYGHMSWLKAHNSGRVTVGVTIAGRSETDHVLSRPVTVDGLVALLSTLSGQEASAAPAPAPTPAPAPAPAPAVPPSALEAAKVTAPAPAMPADPVRTTGQRPAMPAEPDPARTTGSRPAMPPLDAARTTGQRPAMPPREPGLADYLRAGALSGPVKVQLPGAPLLVLDPATQTYLGGSSLKAFQPYGESPLRPDDIHPIEPGELAQMAGKLGAPQPWSRLAWLCALVGHRGTIAPGIDPNAQFKLNKWPQTEREFPKHFRIATVMMKGPARLTEIAEQSGVPLPEVTDFVNASLATGYAATA
jgi:hypothetical protein